MASSDRPSDAPGLTDGRATDGGSSAALVYAIAFGEIRIDWRGSSSAASFGAATSEFLGTSVSYTHLYSAACEIGKARRICFNATCA